MGLFSNILTKVFGRKKGMISSEFIDLTEETLIGILKKGCFDFSYNIQQRENNILVELDGKDKQLLKKRGGELLDALQFFIKKVLQHQFHGQRIFLRLDSKSSYEDFYQDLLNMADRLKETALRNSKSVYFKPLPPKERRVVHRHLSDDARIKTKSIGDDYYKKIKIIPLGEERSKTRGRSRSSYYKR